MKQQQLKVTNMSVILTYGKNIQWREASQSRPTSRSHHSAFFQWTDLSTRLND